MTRISYLDSDSLPASHGVTILLCEQYNCFEHNKLPHALCNISLQPSFFHGKELVAIQSISQDGGNPFSAVID